MVRCLLFLLFLPPPLLAQPPLALPGHLPAPQVNLGPYTAVFKDVSGDTLPLTVIRQETFRPFAGKTNERASFPTRSVLVTWLRFTLRNTHAADTLKLLHHTGTHGLITLYEDSRLMGQTGIALPPQRRPSRFALALSLPPGVEQTYFVRVVDYFRSPTPVLSELLTDPASVAR
ncbi:MAG: hypothetical protein H7Y12_04080, partial [Sphingobacteriaceae bacterium]|nr:hypothetical protein [Cytophagaceae bacterium]